MSFLKKALGLVTGIVGAVIGFAVGGPMGAAIGFSVGMGIGSAAQMAAMKTKVPDVSSATTQRLNVTIDPEAHRKIAFGETALGTDQVYWEAYGPESSHFDQVIAAAGHKIESFGKLYFDDEEVTFSGDNASGAYAGALSKQDRTVGVTGTALTVGAGTRWTSAASLTGVAHYALKIIWSQEKYPRGIPNRITRVGKGALVYDPRRDSTVPGGSGTHRADDQSTWEYSPLDSNGQPIGRNPALQILWYEIGWRVQNPDTSEWILTCGRGRPLDDIDLESFITAANDCEDAEYLDSNGDPKTGYYSDVLLSTGDAHETNIAVLEAACAGKLMDPGGRVSLKIRNDTTGDIVQAFTEDDVLDSDASTWRPSLPLSERWNQGVGSFVDPRALYKLVPLPMLRDTTYETEDGFKRPGPTFRFDAVQDPDQAQALIRLELNMSRYQGVFTAPFNWRAKKVRIWDCVTLTFPRLGFATKIFRVLDKKTDPMGAIWLLLREDGPSVYTSGTVLPVPPPAAGAGYDPRVVTAPDAGDWTVTPAYIEGGGAKIPSLLLSGTGIAANIVSTKAYTRLGVGGEWVLRGTYDSRQAVNIALADLVPGGTYYVGLVYQNAYGVSSAMTTLGPYSSPADFVALTSLLSDGFVGQGALATLSAATWATQVTGVGKPEDYATLSRVFRQDSAPSSPSVNDIWVQTSGGSPIAVRAWNGSSWVTGADITSLNTAAAFVGQGALATLNQATWATQVTGVGKPEDYATLSRVFRQSTAPSSPNTNDIWVQLSGSDPIAVKAWNGSAWVTGADITLINTAASFVGQDWGATASESAASNSQVPASASNRVRYSEMEFGVTGYAIVWNPDGILTTGPFYGTFNGYRYIRAEWTSTTAGERLLMGTDQAEPNARIRVTPGERLSIQSRCESQAGSGAAVASTALRVSFFDASDVLLSEEILETRAGNTYLGDIPLRGFVTVPSSAVYARIYFALLTGGASTGILIMSRPMVSGAHATQIEHPAYTPGLNAEDGADPTIDNTAAAFVGQGALATLNQATWATQVTGVGKPEDYATLSRVFRQSTAPSSPNTNDIWVQLSGSDPIAVKAWNGSAWVTGADITLINTAAGFVGQGGLATQNSVGTTTIDAGAVSGGAANEVAGQQSINSSTWTTLASQAVTVPSGAAFIALFFSSQAAGIGFYSHVADSTLEFRLTRNGVEIWSGVMATLPGPIAAYKESGGVATIGSDTIILPQQFSGRVGSFDIDFSPGSGTVTYNLQARRADVAGDPARANWILSDRKLMVDVRKR